MTYIIHISQDYPNIAREEIKVLLGIDLEPYIQGYFFTKNKIDIDLVKRLGLTKSVYKVLEEYDTSNEEEILEKINYKLFENTYKIDMLCFEGIEKEAKPIADKIFHKITNPKVDIKKPDHKYVFFWSLTEVRLCELIYLNEDSTHDRRSHLKEYNHPTSIHPKLAKAMINLGTKKEFIDPFCGAGGIVIEGAMMNLEVKGSDVDEIMIKRASANAKAYGLEIDFEIKDALRMTEKTECIITDLPYGKNSKLTADLINLYCDFFTVANTLTDKIIVGMHGDTDVDTYLGETDFEIEKQFTIYVHKSMTRTITILTKEV